ncbi:MAG TPA: glycosyl transferase family 36 [Candidatus Aminicenantes bacterium]|nr:glycosyl transferase family 36 [Candidatus Aminicenantes bacterium]
MAFGRFSEDGREFLITDVRTPSPWINYLENGRYFATISANGGGISYDRSPLHGRITRYRINDVPPDRPGKYIYVKDRDSGEVWSLTWQPVGREPASAYRVAHGFGYTRAEAEVEGIGSSVVFFVPVDEDREIWKAVLTNRSGRRRRLSVVGYVEFALGHALVDLINQCDDQHFNRARFDKRLGALFATKTYWVTETRGTQHQENKAWDRWAYFTVNRPVAAYETVRERFIGPHGNESDPLGIRAGLSSRDMDCGNAAGALQVDLELGPDESVDVVFSLGVIAKTEFERVKGEVVGRYRDAAAADAALDRVRAEWARVLGRTRAVTPEPEADVFLNAWIPYQAKVAFDVGRVASFYYWGIGRGFGYRDTAQDTIAIVVSDPAKARARVGLLARQMRRDGKVYHHFYGDGQGEFTGHCDDPLWFVLALTEYLKETGDLALLDASEPFLDGGAGTILEHLLAVGRFAGADLGPHGLPRFGRGDWNDTLDYIGGRDGGESVWGAMFYVAMLNRLLELLAFLKVADAHPEVRGLRDRLVDAIEEHAWDGDWYIRAFGEAGKRIGSKDNRYGRIFLNTQSWAVIAGLPDRARLVRAMDSVAERLDTPYGPKICAPAFREIDPAIGLVTRCVAGKKENAAVFCHPAAWAVQAECLLGRGGRASALFRKLLPGRIDQAVFSAEPYVYSQYITSDEHPDAGKASHSWQTGTAAWMYRVAFDDILGIRPSYEGLVVDPAIPAEWKSFRVERVFRGARYLVEVENGAGVERGVAEVLVDGRPVEGPIAPRPAGAACRVSVRMGRER